VTPAATDLLGS